MVKTSIFIDGEAGTTGLEIRKKLESRADVEILKIAPDKRKEAAERKRLLNAADLAILCLPDEAAREAAALIDNPRTKILDASTAHRTAKSWVYGFPEMAPGQGDAIRAAKRVSNPGCYATGVIGLLRPLTDAGLVPCAAPITINAISGYSGGGKELIAICEAKGGDIRGGPFCAYGLDQKHKHIGEMKKHGGLDADPIFLPSYSASFYRGMLIEIGLRMDDMNKMTGKKADGAALHAALTARYAGQEFIKLAPLHTELEKGFVLSPLAQNETNNLELHVFWNAEKQFAVLAAILDNLGKGASGAAVQNAEIMLGLQ
ncbi:MAG TPA: N-acetyl-gamma-glutamyl-phosphate reductase [Alphaproteobacteria bacterium]|nr:N-acetyl-gamma-glutamyl-phosphate reductase [Alphaproteobacteria bacterium]